jgi:hypothetical protein
MSSVGRQHHAAAIAGAAILALALNGCTALGQSSRRAHRAPLRRQARRRITNSDGSVCESNGTNTPFDQ